MMKLNCGSGKNYLDDWINLDWYTDKCDIVHDLNMLPLPFEDNMFDVVLLDNVLEHLSIYHYDFMVDIHRILKVGGIVDIYLPFYAPNCGHVTWHHKKGYFNSLCGGEGNRGHDAQGKKLFVKIDERYCRRRKRYILFGKNLYVRLKKI